MRWGLYRTGELRPAASKDVVWESDFTTLTLEIAPAGSQREGSPRPVTRQAASANPRVDGATRKRRRLGCMRRP